MRWRISTPGCLLPIGRVAPQVAGAHKSALHRIESSLGPALQLELAKDVAHMSLHRLLADPELASDLLVRLAFRDETKHSGLALGEGLWTSGDLHLANQAGRGF